MVPNRWGDSSLEGNEATAEGHVMTVLNGIEKLIVVFAVQDLAPTYR